MTMALDIAERTKHATEPARHPPPRAPAEPGALGSDRRGASERSPRNSGSSTRFMGSPQSTNWCPRAGQKTATVISAPASGPSPRHHHESPAAPGTGSGGREAAGGGIRDRERLDAREL